MIKCVEFDKVIEEYNLQYKVQSIVNDNAANMRKAFSTKFLEQTTDDENNLSAGLAGNVNALTASADDDEIDKAELWNDLLAEDTTEMERPLISHTRLQCYEPTLQLCVNDGLKAIKLLTAAMGKASKFSSLLHTSSTFREIFEAEFGRTRIIPSANSTR